MHRQSQTMTTIFDGFLWEIFPSLFADIVLMLIIFFAAVFDIIRSRHGQGSRADRDHIKDGSR